MSDFQSSRLGTHEYWDEAYDAELQSFKETGDVGEVWFGEEVQERMVRWLSDKSEMPMSSHILDLGCGNGMLLHFLREEGFSNLMGVDYSEGAIQLSKSILEQDNIKNVNLEVCDILCPDSVSRLCHCGHYDVCLDKGTYDAISLRDPTSSHDRNMYCENVRCLLRDDGLLLITSCNWTRLQLEQQFLKDFDIIHELPAPKFTFGGQTGQTVTTLALKKKAREEIDASC